MPFTISHVAAVIPGHRWLSRWHVFSAAVIGSMTPDFGMMMPISLTRSQTHSLNAVWSFCLPLGLVAYWLTRLVIKPAIIEVLPDRSYSRLRNSPPGLPVLRLRSWIAASAAIVGGALTHLVWDGFTHEDARGVQMFPMLEDYGPDVAGHPLQLFRWLQHASTVLGLIVVIVAVVLWLRHAPRLDAPVARRLRRAERTAWLAAYLFWPLLGIAWAVSSEYASGHSPWSSGPALGSIAVAGMQGAAAALVLISALIRVRLAFA